MLESIFSEAAATISTEGCLISMGVAIVLGIIISVINKITTKTTNNFLITVAILPLLAEVVIILVNGNLGTSLAVAGAFTLVRFRSMQGTSKEIITILKDLKGRINCLIKLSIENIGSGGQDNIIKIWNIDKKQVVAI